MDDTAVDTLCKRAMVELVFLLAHQRHPRVRQRRDWSLLRSLVREGLAAGPRPDQLQEGPWQVGQRPLRQPDATDSGSSRWCGGGERRS